MLQRRRLTVVAAAASTAAEGAAASILEGVAASIREVAANSIQEGARSTWVVGVSTGLQHTGSAELDTVSRDTALQAIQRTPSLGMRDMASLDILATDPWLDARDTEHWRGARATALQVTLLQVAEAPGG